MASDTLDRMLLAALEDARKMGYAEAHFDLLSRSE